jgi:surface polysaccharide O-acyltransferase-like enzyme
MVFIIHVNPFTEALEGSLSPFENRANFWMQNFLCRLAVPFYFVCSGFFLFKKMPSNDINIELVKKYCFKLLHLLGVWTVLLFIGGHVHLWYLGATVVAVVLLSICLYYHIKIKYLVIAACALYTVGLLDDSYFGLIQPFISEGPLSTIYDMFKYFVMDTRNGFFMGYIFVLIGYLFAQGKFKIEIQVAFACLCVSLLCLFAEVFALHFYDIPDDHNMFIFLVPATFFLFAFASSLSFRNRPVYAKLRTVGSLMYFSHLFIQKLVGFGISMIYGIFKIDILPAQFLISLLVTALVAFGIEGLSHKEKFKWINWFIS